CGKKIGSTRSAMRSHESDICYKVRLGGGTGLSAFSNRKRDTLGFRQQSCLVSDVCRQRLENELPRQPLQSHFPPEVRAVVVVGPFCVQSHFPRSILEHEEGRG